MSRAALLALAALATACTLQGALPPDPAAVARAEDRALGERLRLHLAALPTVADAQVVIERPAPDPLARRPVIAAPSVAIAVVADGDAPTADLDVLTRAAARTLFGDHARVSVAIVPLPARPALARLGPFTVAAGARAPLLALVAGALALVAALALTLTVVLARQRRSARPG